MERLKNNQILLEISEDKKTITVNSGFISYPVAFGSCPAKVLENIPNVIQSYAKEFGFDELPGWEEEKCGYEGGKCIDCN